MGRNNFSNGPLQYLGDSMGTMNKALKGMNLDKIGPMLRGECEWGGRDRKRWKRLIIFYTLYYIGIFGLFFLVVYWFNLGTQAGSDGKRPLLHGRGIQSPGINYQPRLANGNSDHKEHIDNYHRDIDSQTAFVYKSNSGGHKIYSNQMKMFIESEFGKDTTFDQAYGTDENGEKVDWGDCTEAKEFGFKDDKPCLFFRVNKVIDWSPIGIFAEDIEAAFSHDDSNILSSEGYCSAARFQEYCKTDKGKEAIKKIKSEIFSADETRPVDETYNAPFVKCLGYKGADKVQIKTYPANGRLAWTEAFKGKDSTEGRAGRSIFAPRTQSVSNKYKSPLVAVQFDFSHDGAKNTDALFHCFMFDRNMEIETRKQASGMVKLAARVNK